MAKSYNGFDPDQRRRAFAWLQREYAAGRRTRPHVCDACGQTEGVLQAHSEDYSGPPFGAHIGGWGLCYRCHMMVHCRFGSPEAWTTYKRHIREGRIFVPIGRNFGLFCDETLRRQGDGVPYRQGRARDRTPLLDDLQ